MSLLLSSLGTFSRTRGGGILVSSEGENSRLASAGRGRGVVTSVCRAVAITTTIALPLQTSVPMKTMFILSEISSPMSTIGLLTCAIWVKLRQVSSWLRVHHPRLLGGWVLTLSRGSASPVRFDSSTLRLLQDKTRQSAATRSPLFRRTDEQKRRVGWMDEVWLMFHTKKAKNNTVSDIPPY